MIQIDGDSIAEGIGASATEKRWYELFNPVNYAVSSSQAADVSGRQRAVAVDDEYFIGIGGNDAAFYKNDPVKQEYFRRVFRSILAWRLLLSRKTGHGPQAGITFTGTWADMPTPSPCGKYTTQTGAAATATVSGTSVYVEVSECDYPDMGENISVKIDGVEKGPFSVKRPGVTTYLGQWWGRVVWAFDGLAAGNHTVVITQNSPNGKFLHLSYIAGSDQTASPVVIVGNAMKFTDAYYATLGIDAATTQAYNAIIAAVVAEFIVYGLPVTLLDRYAHFDPATQSADQWGHPNDAWQRSQRRDFLTTYLAELT